MKPHFHVIGVFATMFILVVVNFGCGSPTSTRDLSTWMGENGNVEHFDQVDGSHRLTFPIDHGPHEEYLFEWWYLTSILDDQKGREFGVQFTIFRRALTPPTNSQNRWRSGQIYLAHFAISDIQKETLWSDERFSRGHPKLAGVQANPFRVFVEDWSLASSQSSFFPLELSADSVPYKVALTIDHGKPMILHGDNGYSQKSAEHASYYYSFSSLATAGTIEIEGKTYEVSGKSWMDREWSSQMLSESYRGWFWFSLAFDDGRELVLFELQSDDRSIKTIPTAMWIEVDGTTHSITSENWKIEPRRYWRSYPVSWILEVDESQYLVEAKFDDQVMDTTIRYWEGVVEVKEANEVVGRGYMELTGYE